MPGMQCACECRSLQRARWSSGHVDTHAMDASRAMFMPAQGSIQDNSGHVSTAKSQEQMRAVGM